MSFAKEAVNNYGSHSYNQKQRDRTNSFWQHDKFDEVRDNDSKKDNMDYQNNNRKY